MVAYERTYVVVIDSARARFFRRDESGRLAKSLPDIAAPIQPGARPEASRQARLKFLQLVKDALGKACDTAQFERLVVIAPERVLSQFRKHAPDKIRARLWRERAHARSESSVEEIARLIEPYFGSAPSGSQGL